MPMIAPPPDGPGFAWLSRDWGWSLVCERLSAFTHGWTAGVTPSGHGGPCGVRADQLAAGCGVAAADVVSLRQVHGAEVLAPARASDREAAEDADAVVTHDANLLLTVRVADCVPLLIADTHRGAVAAVHAGWRGTSAGIAQRAVERLATLYGSRPSDLVAAAGPAIGACCYRVGDELRQDFSEHGWPDRSLAAWFRDGDDGALRLDLSRANRDQLEEAGVPRSAVLVSRLCTACHPGWFPSYRREGPRAGRMAAYIRAAPSE
jgi:YfiH family protein